ncbi:titin-like isoform X3 [Macrosteles quadrilineatus]|uniref:titin-like isoform X3 n=1 Tax=Macrosteles quadrilineatus TaxID=74068 RepID=UPI0023E2F7D6|nr:titin-like isoform X3 [Macrosteles quadrilineatus]
MPPVFIHNMPAVNPNNPNQGAAQRTTFRPPWVKEGPSPLPMPSAPWTARGREQVAPAPAEPNKVENKGPRKLSKVTIIPSQPAPDNNAQKQETSVPVYKAVPSVLPEKKQDTLIPVTKTQSPVDAEKKQDSNTPVSKKESPYIIDKKNETPVQSTKLQVANPSKKGKSLNISNPEQPPFKELFSQANLKRTPKKEKKAEPPSLLTPNQALLALNLKKEQLEKANVTTKKKSPSTNDQDNASSMQFTAKRPSAFIKPKEGPSGRRRESTDKVVPVVIESSTPKEPRRESVVRIQREPEKEPPKAAREFAKPVPKPVEREPPKSILKDPSKTSIPKPPPPPMAPPPPPPPPGQTPIIKSELTPQKAAKLDALRSRPRRRPDWTDMMKEVEEGIKLKHIVCNDRSAPILPKEKAKGQFIYQSEKEGKADPHKQLLHQIENGVRLKKVKCNDRSKPVLDGLRKFRRQMTIEEQIQKSKSMADVIAEAAEPDELDDIDKVRDDLQSSKQMLAIELRNKEALERENKRLMARLLNLEVELEKEKGSRRLDAEKGNVSHVRSEADEKLVKQLKEEASEANKVAKEMEEKYKYTAEELDATRAKLESAWLKNQQLEMELKSGARNSAPITKQPSSKKLAASMASMPNGKTVQASDDESEYTEETETETESEEEGNEEDAAALQERRTQRELKLLATKLRSYKEKQGIALKERHILREQLRKQQKILREEKKKYKALQKEVDKMVKLMKDDEEGEEEKPEEEEEEEETETESESESEESEEDDPTDGDLPEDATVDEKRKNLQDRSKHHENRLGTLKKGNYLLKANIDRLQDDINRQKEMSLSLQEDLNSVLAELG